MSANMTMEKYEKPAMKFISLRNEEAVAATCWGNHGTDYTYYCDIQGAGYVSFQIGQGNCSMNLVNVTYYDNEGNSSAASEAQIEALKQTLIENSNNGKGTNHSAMGSIVLPDPSPAWS